MLTLVLGGVRSGKSRVAEMLATRSGRPVTYVATGVIHDDDFRTRVEEHRRRRPSGWETVEEPIEVSTVIAGRPGATLVVDCLGFLVTNVLFGASVGASGDAGAGTDGGLDGGSDAGPDAASDGSPDAGPRAQVLEGRALRLVEELAAAAEKHDGLVIVVSNETGQGVVPPYPAGRLFRDVLGRANQIMAGRAEHVFYMIAGIPLDIKSLSGPFGLPGGEGLRQND